MKKSFALYYFLFLALILGGFSSMAQNDYGLKIVGFSSLGFSLLFILQSISSLFNKEKKGNLISFFEYLSLSIIATVFSLRAFFIHFNNVELIFSAASVVLAAVYLYKMMKAYRASVKDSKIMALLIAVFLLSIIVFITSFIIAPFYPEFAEILGGISFGLLVIFVVISLIKKEVLFEGEKISPIQYVLQYKDSSLIIIGVFLIFSLYIGLAKFDFLPKLYSSELPQGYIELINQAEGGEEELVDGKFKYEIYKDYFDRFMERNLEDNK